MQIEFTRQPDKPPDGNVAPMALGTLRRPWRCCALSHIERNQPHCCPPSLPQLLQPRLVMRATYPLGSSRRHGPCSHGPLRHLGSSRAWPLARVVDKRCAHQASGLCHPDHDADARPPLGSDDPPAGAPVPSLQCLPGAPAARLHGSTMVLRVVHTLASSITTLLLPGYTLCADCRPAPGRGQLVLL